jgi:hypothetical protein
MIIKDYQQQLASKERMLPAQKYSGHTFRQNTQFCKQESKDVFRSANGVQLHKVQITTYQSIIYKQEFLWEYSE